MRLLFDESVTRKLRKYLPGHEISTVVEMGWGGTKNGKLLALAGQSFDALITVDKNMRHQQNLTNLPLSIVVLNADSNELVVLVEMVENLEMCLASLQPKTLVVVEP